MGIEKIGDFISEKENVDEDILSIGQGILGKVEIDIMSPLDPEKSPKVHIPALNHIGLWIDKLPEAV
jgi:lactoylglutathione lyase